METTGEKRSALLDALIKAIPIPAVAIDGEERPVKWNRAFAGLAGLPAEGIRRATLAGMFGSPPAVAAEEPAEWELRSGSSSGGRMKVTVTSLPDAEPLRLVCFHRGEESDPLSEKIEALSLFARKTAHDFNNFLMAISGNNSLAMMDVEEEHPARRFLEQVELAAARAEEFTRLLQTYAGRSQGMPRNLPVNEVVAAVSEKLGELADDIVVEFAADAGNPVVNADLGQLSTALEKIVANSVEALDGHTGVITLRTGTVACSEPPVGDVYLVENFSPGQYVYIEVSDNGCGMDREARRCLFDPFYTTKKRGRGLGLAPVLGIVRIHQGLVTLDSRPGEGTCVRIMLPAAERADSSNPIKSPPDCKQGALARTVLLVEDEPCVAEVAISTLERAGFRVLAAPDGEKALALFEEYHASLDAVVLDIIMPGLDGTEVFRKMMALDSSVSVLFSSGYHDAGVLPRETDVYIGFIAKPYQPRDLEAELEKLLARKAQAESGQDP